MIPWWKIVFGEDAAAAVSRAVREGKMVMGPVTEELERRLAGLLGVEFVIGTCSGTAALTIALLEAGAGPGVDVVVPDQTWVATANAVLLTGARVILADTEKERRVLSPETFEKAITPDARIVLPVHLNGKSADMPAIRNIAERHGIAVIEDSAQSFMSASPEGGFLGTHSSAGCFSMSMGKVLCCGQGGFVVTDKPERARRLRLARLHGTDDVYAGKWELKGGNFRLWDLPASIALQQMDMLESRMNACRAVYRLYEQELEDRGFFHLVKFDLAKGEFPLYAECMCEDRESFIQHMKANGVQVRANYQPLHTVPHFSSGNEREFPHSIRHGANCVILPCGPDRTEQELETVVRAVKRWR